MDSREQEDLVGWEGGPDLLPITLADLAEENFRLRGISRDPDLIVTTEVMTDFEERIRDLNIQEVSCLKESVWLISH